MFSQRPREGSGRRTLRHRADLLPRHFSKFLASFSASFSESFFGTALTFVPRHFLLTGPAKKKKKPAANVAEARFLPQKPFHVLFCTARTLSAACAEEEHSIAPRGRLRAAWWTQQELSGAARAVLRTNRISQISVMECHLASNRKPRQMLALCGKPWRTNLEFRMDEIHGAYS